MKTSAKLCGIAAALLLAASFNASAAETVNPYVHSSSGQIVKNSTDLCWRTGFWTPDRKSTRLNSSHVDTLFNFDRATLKPEGQAVLDDLVSRIAGVDIEVILSTGYADRIGKPAYNEKLSQRRADAVKAYLVQKGVDAALIKTEGKGSADPVVNCPNPSKAGQIKNFRALVDCLQPNRRAVVEVVGSRPAM